MLNSLEWIPFSHLFYDQIQNDNNDKNKHIKKHKINNNSSMNKMIQYKYYNYENIISQACNLTYRVDYIFTNEAMRNLSESITYLPQYIPQKWKLSKKIIDKQYQIFGLN